MNREVIQAVRDNIATVPESAFCMATFGTLVSELQAGEDDDGSKLEAYWRHNKQTFKALEEGSNACGTTMCIAGRTCAMFDPGTRIGDSVYVAEGLMGLERFQANHLFLGNEDIEAIANITKEQAVACLDNLLATGRISWQDVGVPVSVVDDAEYNDEDDFFDE
jgi:hypothetical protein